jgi:hypothetical protein
MGPDFDSLSTFLSDVGEAISVDLVEMIDLSDGTFWIVLQVVIYL